MAREVGLRLGSAAMPEVLHQYSEVVADAIAFLSARGYVLDVDFVSSHAVALAGQVMLSEGWGPSTFRLEAA